MVEVVGVFIATGDGQHARPQNVGDAMRHQQLIAWIGDQRSEPGGEANGLLDGTEQHHTAVGGEATAIKRGGDFLAVPDGSENGSRVLSVMAGVAPSDSLEVWPRQPNLCCRSDAYATSASESLTCNE